MEVKNLLVILNNIIDKSLLLKRDKRIYYYNSNDLFYFENMIEKTGYNVVKRNAIIALKEAIKETVAAY